MALTGTSYSILSELFVNDKSAILNSMSIQQLVENTSISQGAVYKSVDMLLGTGYIAEGARIGSASTYYITSDGINHLVIAYGAKNVKDLKAMFN